MLSPSTVIVIYVALNTIIMVYATIQNNNTINGLNKKLNKYSNNIENYAANENDIIEKLSEKLHNLESYITDLERKIINLKVEIEVNKEKKKTKTQ